MSSRPALVTLILLAMLAAAVPAQGCDPWPVSLQLESARSSAADGAVLQAASYELDILGPLAVGVLELRFLTGSSGSYRFLQRAPPQVRLTGLEITADGAPVAGGPVEEPPSRSFLGLRLRERLPSPTFQLASGQEVLVRIQLQSRLPCAEGQLHLRLPSPPAVPANLRARVRYELQPIVESPTHVLRQDHEWGAILVELAEPYADAGGSLELVLTPEPASEPQLQTFIGPVQDGKHSVLITMTPGQRTYEGSGPRRQVLFLLDTSYSMSGEELQCAKQAVDRSLDLLELEDRVNLLHFDTDVASFLPVAGELAAVRQAASAWLRGLQADGGTRLAPALEQVLEQPEVAEHHRMIVLLTDGYIYDAKVVLDLLHRKLGSSRLFAFGIGPTCDLATLQQIAEYGRGTAVVVEETADVESALLEFMAATMSPLVWDLELDLGGAEIEYLEVGTHLPDLYPGVPLVVLAELEAPPPPEITLRGQTSAGERYWYSMPVEPGAVRARRWPQPRWPRFTLPAGESDDRSGR
jgi:uncharacterized protein YegL